MFDLVVVPPLSFASLESLSVISLLRVRRFSPTALTMYVPSGTNTVAPFPATWSIAAWIAVIGLPVGFRTLVFDVDDKRGGGRLGTSLRSAQ